ncbi:MAG: TIGR03905 family TSCPD domain-containing protein [bacterium]|nr:TIGR03905 family TSCPD domain-containing protein [bacterium]
MFHYEYKTENVCSQLIKLDLDGDTVHNVIFIGGCNGNLKAISKLVEGMKADQLVKLLSGNTCGGKPTSCADQLAIAVRQACAAQNIKV